MQFETTVADLSPAHLFGLMVSALFWVWVVFTAVREFDNLDGGGKTMLVICLGFMIGLPVWLALGALAPVDPPFWLQPTAVASAP